MSIAVVAGLAFLLDLGGDPGPVRKPPEIQIVQVRPQPKEKMPEPEEPEIPEEPQEIEEPEITEPIEEPEPVEEQAESSEPEDDPAGLVGVDTEAVGAGDSFNLASKSGYGGGLLAGGGRGGGGLFTTALQKQIEDILRENRKVSSARIQRLPINVWADSMGRIIEVRLVRSTGYPDIDEEIRRALLAELDIQYRPTATEEMPVRLRVSVAKSS
ncbi:energy transducer TonB [Tepidicaulis sp. LMO-SS28]|uniref:energy transducer TonB n=1 Tax=Tepidicaulis sp. LMO-SS28 TaxID=3447455 RepID=UPI003EE2B62D